MRVDLSTLSELWRELRGRLTKRRLVVGGVVAGILLLAGIGLGPVARGQISAAAARRRIEVTVGSVHPAWLGVRLRDVDLRLQSVPGVSVRLDEVRVGLTLGLKVHHVEVHGGRVALLGKSEQLRGDLERWRGDRPDQSDGGQPRSALPVSADLVSLLWNDGSSAEPRIDVSDVRFSRDGAGIRVGVPAAHVRIGRTSISFADASAELDSQMMLRRSHVRALVLELPHAASVSSVPPAPAADAGTAAGPAGSPIVATRTQPARARAAPQTAAPPADPSAPFITLPDLRNLRRAAAALAAELVPRCAEGAEAKVDALTWKIAQSGGVALTIGPGPVSLMRTATALELEYSTNTPGESASPASPATAATPASGPPPKPNRPALAGDNRADARVSSLSMRAVLPTDGADVSLTLEGGPVSLSLLGIQEGAAGLVDVSRGNVVGRARIVLAGDGSALSFDAELGAHGLSVSNPKLSSDLVRGLNLELRARGAASAGGEIRLDDFAATVGAIRLTGSGVLDQQPDFVTAALRFDVPTSTCQSLLGSIPSALLPALQGTELSGTFGARGHFAFDSRAPESLDLQYDVRDDCHMVNVAEELTPARFRQPFVHPIYLPDGTTAEDLTGPGTTNWTALQDISPYMQVAVLTTEDGAFPHHHGFNHGAIRSSIIANLKARRFVRGASTITMQLAKNLFLSREKTLSRKIEELVLTDYLEQTFTKDEILELYLNVIEFGPAVYGITAAAEYYFGRTPAELNLAECLFLSSLLPAPLRYSTMRDADQPTEGWMRTIRMLMQVAHKTGLISDGELAEGLEEPVAFWHGGDERPPPRAPVHARIRLDGDAVEAVPPFDAPADIP